MRCCTCKEEKPIEAFHKNKTSCKECRKLERASTYQRRKEKEYDAILTYNRNWAANNPELKRAASKRWNQANKETCRIICNKRYSYAKAARVAWANKDSIEEFYREAQRKTQESGEQWEVDHIIPLRGDTVSGLHVETNLRVITRSENARKRNSFYQENSVSQTQC